MKFKDMSSLLSQTSGYFAKAITCLVAVTFIQISFHFTDIHYHFINFFHLFLHSEILSSLMSTFSDWSKNESEILKFPGCFCFVVVFFKE